MRKTCFIMLLMACPGMLWAQHTPLDTIYRMAAGAEMDAVYKSTSHDGISEQKLDYIRSYIASVFAFENKEDMVDFYAGELAYGPGKGGHYFMIARAFDNARNAAQMERFARLAVDSAFSYVQVKDEGAMGPASILASSVMLLANILERQQRYGEAVTVLSDKLGYCSDKNIPGLLTFKAEILMKAGAYSQALDVYNQLLKARSGGKLVEDQMKVAYAELHDTDTSGFSTYLAGIKDHVMQDFIDSIGHSKKQYKAVDFALMDLSGKKVSLADYKGKVVVLDFWATWCGPCKASFPAMQLTIDKYISDRDVVFLFIDTWEDPRTTDNMIREVVEKKNYTFRVLLDKQDAATGLCNVVKKYGIDGIPAKFVIDKKGNVRYQLEGFGGTDDESVRELSAMIEFARKE